MHPGIFSFIYVWHCTAKLPVFFLGEQGSGHPQQRSSLFGTIFSVLALRCTVEKTKSEEGQISENASRSRSAELKRPRSAEKNPQSSGDERLPSMRPISKGQSVSAAGQSTSELLAPPKRSGGLKRVRKFECDDIPSRSSGRVRRRSRQEILFEALGRSSARIPVSLRSELEIAK